MNKQAVTQVIVKLAKIKHQISRFIGFSELFIFVLMCGLLTGPLDKKLIKKIVQEFKATQPQFVILIVQNENMLDEMKKNVCE